MWSSILRSIRSGVRVGLVLLMLPASANAQSGAGSGLSGRVTDISGAPMAGVTITVSRARRWRGANSDHEQRLGEDTLILFTADHSYDLRVHDGRRGKPLLPELDQDFGDDQDSIRLDNVRREDDHTGEEVIVAARGPGSANVKGVMSNVDLFGIMREAFGWR